MYQNLNVISNDEDTDFSIENYKPEHGKTNLNILLEGTFLASFIMYKAYKS